MGRDAQAVTASVDGALRTIGEQALAGMAAVHPGLLAEPTKNLTTLLSVMPTVPVTGYAASPSVSLTAVVDPWSTRMVAGWLNLTATPIGGASSTSVLATGPPLDTVTLLRDPPEPIADSASVWTGQYVYVFGGERAGGNVLQYEPSLNTWTTMNASFPSTLTLPSAVWAGTTAYIFGGYANGPQGTIYQYDPATDTLSQVGTMNPRSATAAVWDGQYAYILGGRTTNTAVSTVLRFDPLTATITNHGSLASSSSHGSAAYDGQFIHYFGGAYPNTNQRDTIIRYDPTTQTSTTLAARLPSARIGTTAFYDGTHTWVLGGPTNEALRFDSTTSSLTRMWAPFPASVNTATSVWTGMGALIFGGRATLPLAQTFGLDTSLHVLWANYLTHGPMATTTVPVTLEEGHTYTAQLHVIDDYENEYTDTTSFAYDSLAPTLVEAPASMLYANAAKLVSWRVQDTNSGLASVIVETRTTGAWTMLGAQEAFAGTRALTEFARSVPLGVEGATTQVRLRATDVAGNQLVSPTTTITWDLTPPMGIANFTDAIDRFVNWTSLNASVWAWDNLSGLTTIRVWLENDTGFVADIVNTTFTGQTQTGELSNAWNAPMLDEAYQMRILITDRAGNTYANTTKSVEISVPPVLDIFVPAATLQAASRVLTFNLSAWLPIYQNLSVDTLQVLVSNSAGGEVFRENVSAGSLVASWNTTLVSGGNYTVTYESNRGKSKTMANSTILVETYNATATKLQYHRSYGSLDGLGDRAYYRIVHPASCGTPFYLRAQSLNGTSIGMYATQGEPDPNKDPQTYDEVQDSNSTQQNIRWEIATPLPITLLITNKGTGANQFWIDYTTNTGCSQGSAGKTLEPPTYRTEKLAPATEFQKIED